MYIHVFDAPSAQEQRAIVQLAAAAEAADEVAPFSEQPLMDLAAARETQRQILAFADPQSSDDQETSKSNGEKPAPKLVGAALLDTVGCSAELVVHPDYRRQGIATALLAQVRETAQEVNPQATKLAVWAHGDLPAAKATAHVVGGKVERTLLSLGREISDGDTSFEQEPPADVELSTFVPEADDSELLRVNAAAFSWHPEQGRFSQEELDQRKTAPWFDAKYLQLARLNGEISAFVWVKPPVTAGEPAELYVLGVHPDAQGRGLGQFLTRQSLELARLTGARQMVLWVEADNEAALRTYAATGFSEVIRDVQYMFDLS